MHHNHWLYKTTAGALSEKQHCGSNYTEIKTSCFYKLTHETLALGRKQYAEKDKFYFFRRPDAPRSVNASFVKRRSPPLTDALTRFRAICVSIEMRTLIKRLLHYTEYDLWSREIVSRRIFIANCGVVHRSCAVSLLLHAFTELWN